MSEALKSEFAKELQRFIEILENENINLSLFYNNLETLKINYIGNKDFDIPSRDGEYSSTNNIITINQTGKISECIYHELLHCASTRKTDKHTYVGFERVNNEIGLSIGEAINEGFTELLADKYFNTATSYKIERFYVYMLSTILDFKVLEKLYFEGNFDGFIDEFTKYLSKEEVFAFIELSNRCFRHGHYNKRYTNKEISEYIIACANILTRAFKNKLMALDIPLENKQDAILEYMEELSVMEFVNSSTNESYSLRPNAQFAKEVFDDFKMEYTDDERGIDISPHKLKVKKITSIV